MHPPSPAHEIGRTKNGEFKDLTWRVQPQIGPLRQPGPKFGVLLLSGVLETGKSVLAPRYKKRWGKCVSQTVVRLIPVDEPQRHPLFVGVEVENPSL